MSPGLPGGLRGVASRARAVMGGDSLWHPHHLRCQPMLSLL